MGSEFQTIIMDRFLGNVSLHGLAFSGLSIRIEKRNFKVGEINNQALPLFINHQIKRYE